GGVFAPQFALQVFLALHHQLSVESFRVSRQLRHRHHEIQPNVFHPAFYNALFIAPAHRAEVVVEKVVAYQLLEAPCQFSLVYPDQLLHEGLGVVVADPPGYATEIFKGPNVAFPDELRGLPLEYLNEEGIRVGQRHYEIGPFHQHAVELKEGVAKIHLGLAGPVGQRHEDLTVFAFQAPDGLFDLGIAAGVAVLGLEALKDALG